MDAVEVLDTRECIHPAFATTKITVLSIRQIGQPKHCFHDGLPCCAANMVCFRNLWFCSLSCALAHNHPADFPAIFMLPKVDICSRIAPSRGDLLCYGGSFSLEDFRGSTEIPNEIPTGPRCLHDAGLIVDGPPLIYQAGFQKSFFCSDNCLLAHTMSLMGPGTAVETAVRLRQVPGIAAEQQQLFPAPGRELLQIFGGPLTLAEFRGLSKASVFTHVLPPRTLLHQEPRATGLRTHYEQQRFDCGKKEEEVLPTRCCQQEVMPAEVSKPATNKRLLPFRRK